MTTVSRPKVRRQDLKPGEVLCDHCTGKCCHYFALPIDKPTTWQEFDFCRWYLLHDAATIFTEDDTWYLCVHTVCEHLQEDHRCGIYATRPQICRDYSTDECEYDDDSTYERYFETGQQLWEYAEAVLGPQPGGNLRTIQPPLLPVE